MGQRARVTAFAAAVLALSLCGAARAGGGAPAGCAGPASATWLTVSAEQVRGSAGFLVLTLYPDDPQAMDPADRAKLEANGVSISCMPMVRVSPTTTTMEVWTEDGTNLTAFDVVYPCFGTRPRTDLARQLGLTVDDGGCLDSGAHFETSAPGFFAAGDIVRGLDQISVAMGHGAIAATGVHSRLRGLDGEL